MLDTVNFGFSNQTSSRFSLGSDDRFSLDSSPLTSPFLKSNHASGTGLPSHKDFDSSLASSQTRFSRGKSVTNESKSRSQVKWRSLSNISNDSITGIKKGAALVSRTSQGNRIAETVSGRLDFSDALNPTRARAYKDDYLLNNSTGGRVQINMSSSVLDTYLQIVSSATGQVITFNDDSGSSSNSQVSFTAQAGVNYIVRATSYLAFTTGSYSLTAEISGNNPTPPSSGFNSTSGYGLVDAASAVARSLNTSRFSDVTNLGGNNWGNDLVNSPEVWARGYTGRGVTVAVIDSGVDITHSELRNNLWTNSREVANDGIDNDRNGYIDDIYGWNFGVGQNNNNVMPGTNSSGQGHGTHVAGTIAAANNGVATTGVAPNAKIMSLRLGNVDNTNRFTNSGNLAQAIRYAVDNGAKVINMSLGWPDSSELQSAMAYAASRNVITVSSAGNSTLSSPGNPAQYATQYGLSVGAIDRNRSMAGFSNRAGSNAQMRHVVAPGVDIYSTTPNNSWGLKDGTSMASPHVAGVVALMLSANPNLTSAQVRQIVTESAVSQGIRQSSSINSTRRVSQVTQGSSVLQVVDAKNDVFLKEEQRSPMFVKQNN
jgi:subtilisin family serine protease